MIHKIIIGNILTSIKSTDRILDMVGIVNYNAGIKNPVPAIPREKQIVAIKRIITSLKITTIFCIFFCSTSLLLCFHNF